MVSSSPMKVAQFPAEEHHDNEISTLGGSKVESGNGAVFRNVLPDLPRANQESKPVVNGFAPSSDGYSEPSTSESVDGSPRLTDVPAIDLESGDKFVDAPVSIHDVAEGPAAFHGTSEPASLATTSVTPLTLTSPSDSGDSPSPAGQNRSPTKPERAGAPNPPQLNFPPQTPRNQRPGNLRRDSSQAADGAAPRSNSARLRARAQSSGQRSEAQSTTSRRAAAVAAAELEDGVLVGTRVSEGHENFVTAYNMLTGIRVAVSRCTAKNNRPLTDADFTATDEISFSMNGGSSSPSSKYMFHFKDYAPWVFRHLRDAFGLDPADYLMSLTAKYIVSEMGSPGKSGSYFYYSRDFRFIIKTIRHSEHKLLRHILRQYYSHVKENPHTLISQIYGLHRVKVSPGRKIHFLIMNNVFPALYQIHERFDLKGSLLGREYRPDSGKPIVVYKDLDWLRQHKRIILGREKRERLVKQLEIDTRFLERINVMDYSLLVGIHDQSQGNAALDALLKFAQFGPQDERQSQGEKQAASAAVRGSSDKRHNFRNNTAEKEFASLQMLLQRATPERLKEFDFADEYRNQSYFYKEHGGFLSTDENNEELGVIYYIGVIDFLTGYTFRKSVETFCKSLIHDRRELSAVPAKEYGERFLKFLRGSIGPAITSTKPHKRTTEQSQPESTHTDGHGNGSKPPVATATTSRPNGSPATRAYKPEDSVTPPMPEFPSISSSGTPSRNDSMRTTPASMNGQRKVLPQIVTTPVDERDTYMFSAPANSSSRSPTGTAITSDDIRRETAVASAVSASPDASKRRPSVVGYGLDSHIEA